MNARTLALGFVLTGIACRPTPAPIPHHHVKRDLALSDDQQAWLDDLRRAADEHPDDARALKASGLAHMQLTLSGVLHLRDRAERDLEAAFALDPTDRELTRSLGRFYNMRAVAGDFGKADMQVEVYAAHLGTQSPTDMTSSDFVAWSFYQLGQVMTQRNKGSLFGAMATVNRLEDALAARTRAHPDDIEMFALEGNFAFFFAGNVPFDKQRRVETAVKAFETLRERWGDLRPGARDPLHCPNTRENFMFELAEGYLVLDRIDDAREIYQELGEMREPITRAKEQIAHVSRERTRNAERYAGEFDLMPPWPSDVGNCIVCHSWNRDIPMDSLHSVEPVSLDDIPTLARPKPVDGLGAGPVASPRAAIPGELADFFARRCTPCHFESGRAHHLLDLADGTAIEDARERIVGLTTAGEMPPDAELSASERELIQAWASAAND